MQEKEKGKVERNEKVNQYERRKSQKGERLIFGEEM
jgi:hypothetical protein